MAQRADWTRVEEVFHEVADLPLGRKRDHRVADLCGADAQVRAEVQALLDGDALALQAEVAPDPHVGLRLGAYTITRLIARGGMAAVYEGQRDDGAFTQRVAIKIMDLRLSDPALVLRFRAERQILATLEHPAIARLLDGGVTPASVPYLVMEFVDGQPLDRYCDGHRLDIAARLGLFATACDGVSYAHRNLVLHRDLKPSNILVTRAGHLKIVDFGAATLLEPGRVATMSRAPLTPEYASPEQLGDRAVGTSSDQYSLGLVLYELLAGARPFGERTSLMAAIERTLAGIEPRPIHTTVTAEAAALRQTSPRRLQRRLRGDVDTIVRTALAADPTARYQSVGHLADDLARYVSGEPILARPPSVVYRASKVVRRHWLATSIATALSLALVATTVVAVRQARRAEAEAATRANEFELSGLSTVGRDYRTIGRLDDSLRVLLQVYERYLKGDYPRSTAGVLAEIGWTLHAMGHTEEAQKLLEESVRQLDPGLTSNQPSIVLFKQRLAAVRREQQPRGED